MDKVETCILFETYEELAQCMLECSNGEDHAVCAILDYDKAKQLVKELLMFEGTEIQSIYLSDSMWDGYTKEYCVSLDSDWEIIVEKAWHEDNEYHEAGYYNFVDELLLISSDADTNEILKVATEATCYEFEVCEGICTDDDCPIKGVDLQDILEFIADNLE